MYSVVHFHSDYNCEFVLKPQRSWSQFLRKDFSPPHPLPLRDRRPRTREKEIKAKKSKTYVCCVIHMFDQLRAVPSKAVCWEAWSRCHTFGIPSVL